MEILTDLKKNGWREPIVWIIILAFALRVFSIFPYNTIVGFDQARDFFAAKTILSELDLKIIGPTAGNNPNLHHGVLYLYYILPGILFFKGNPAGIAIWNSLWHVFGIVLVYLLSYELLQSKKLSLVTAFIAAISYEFVQYSGWLSNPTASFWSVRLFFLGFWMYYKKHKWGLPLACLAIGLSIQFELFFIYLIPTAILFWILLRPRLPSIRLGILSLSTFLLATSTMIATEIKYNFAGINAILQAGEFVGEKSPMINRLVNFAQKFFEKFALTIFPQKPSLGLLICLMLIIPFLFILKSSKDKKPYIFLFICLLSPSLMLLLGQHNAPWFLIGVPQALSIVIAVTLTRLKNSLLFLVLLLIFCFNFSAIWRSRITGESLLDPDSSALMTNQILAIDYTYATSEGELFTINTVTNPLYINAVWAYQYEWYGKVKYGYLPSWSGSDQLYPYDTLKKSDESEKYLYLLMDNSFRIPQYFRNNSIDWAETKSELIEEKDFDGIIVQKRRFLIEKAL